MSKKPNNEEVKQKLEELERLDLNGLKALWHKYFDYRPAQYQRDFMFRRIAYQIQVQAYGGLSKNAKNKLHRLAFDGQSEMQDKYHPSPGTRLMREYKGKRIYVTVHDNGYEYEGRLYKSLTAISREITGSIMSGPAFFGLRGAE